MKQSSTYIKLAIHALEDYRRKHFAISSHATGFIFGEKAKNQYDLYTNAIEFFNSLLQEKNKNDHL